MAKDYLDAADIVAGNGYNTENDPLFNLLKKVDRQQLADLAGRSLSEIEALFSEPEPEPVPADVRKLDIELPGGFVFRNVNSEEDMGRAMQIMQTLNLSPESLAKLMAGPDPKPLNPEPPPQTAVPTVQEGGTTIQEMVPRFATRRRNNLAVKSLYEYGNYHRKFVEWLELRKKSKRIPVHSITRADIADFIEDLQHDGLSNRTISQKYLAAINGLFTLAQSMGVLPAGQALVTHGHKVFSKKDVIKASLTNSHKPFTDDELKAIFQPSLLNKCERPADFWLPMLGLFTGGRLNELCQLDVADIRQHKGIWGISFIDDAPDKSLKSPAARRTIPVHSTLLECGFLDYVEDAKRRGDGRKLFPYLTYSDKHGYAATPSERWGKYLDELGITDPQKVFHSFRSTSNDRLKQNGVPEESRCQFVGHEHDSVNSIIYSNPHNLDFLRDHVAAKLDYPGLDFKPLKYRPGQFSEMLEKLCASKDRKAAHKLVRQKRAKVGT